jgi:uncharacterized lipoprotein YddW (UPF0748 family)
MTMVRTLMVVAAVAGAALGAQAPRPACAAMPSGAVHDTLRSLASSDSAHVGATAESLRVATAADSLRASASHIGLLEAPKTDSLRAVDYLWVVRTALLDPAELPRIVDQARTMGVRGLLVQVVGRGDAYYRSSLLPPAEALSPALAVRPDYDPLGELATLAHAAGLEVHAWVNCMLVWSAPERPSDRRHLVNAHPEWVACLRDGRRMTRLSVQDRMRLGIEGAFLAPAHPAAREFLGSVVAEIARRYPVDGIHLDYIRMPGVDVGYDPETRARFQLVSGFDPIHVRRLTEAQQAQLDTAWQSFRRHEVTEAVRVIGDSARAARFPMALSAAVLPDTLLARTRYAQAWTDWLRAGLIDRAFTMCYASPIETVIEQMACYAQDPALHGRVVPGIAIYNCPPAYAAAKILGARALGYPRLALYSYDSLEHHPDYWPRLRGSMAAAGGRP